MIWLSIIILLLVLLVGLFSVAGLHGGVSDNMIILRIFRPMRFRSNAHRGVEKLLSLEEEHAYRSGREVKAVRVGVVKQGDKGFDELLGIIKKNTELKGEFQSILLFERPATAQLVGISAAVERFLALNKDGKQEIIPADPFDANKPIRDLRNWIEDEYRKQLAYWMLGILGIWLVANSILIYLLNK